MKDWWAHLASLILIACGDGAFKVNPHISLADTTMNERGFTLSLRRMRRKWEWKMSLRDPIFAQFSAGALNFQSNIFRFGKTDLKSEGNQL